MLKVHFIGEGAVDEGGPRREFFHLLIQEIFSKSGFFDGFPERVILLHDVTGIANNTYYIIGKMISTCIIQGGEAPTCFASAVADYLVYREIKSPLYNQLKNSRSSTGNVLCACNFIYVVSCTFM